MMGSSGIAEGTTVYDAAGNKVGTVREYNAQAGYIDVQKGFLFHKDFYIPLGAVARSDNEGVYLNLNQDDLSGDAYSQPPTAGYGGAGTTAQAGTAAYDTTAYDTQTTTAATNTYDTTAATTGTAEGDIRVPVYEEELVVGKRQEEEGRVRLHKEVVAEQESVPVTLRQEQVVVERVPVQGQATDPGALQDAFQGTDIEVPVMGEQAVVGKQVRAVEEVRLHKDVVAEQEQVSDTVRRERVVVDGVEQAGSTMQTTDDTVR